MQSKLFCLVLNWSSLLFAHLQLSTGKNEMNWVNILPVYTGIVCQIGFQDLLLFLALWEDPTHRLYPD